MQKLKGIAFLFLKKTLLDKSKFYLNTAPSPLKKEIYCQIR